LSALGAVDRSERRSVVSAAAHNLCVGWATALFSSRRDGDRFELTSSVTADWRTLVIIVLAINVPPALHAASMLSI
jgi:hypothetical protein